MTAQSPLPADFDQAVLGAGLPPAAEALIAQAGQCRHAPQRALALLQQARDLAPSHPATLIALYRFYFYGNQLAPARAVAAEALVLGAQALGQPADWRTAHADERFGRFEEAAARFYLFALKGYAYLSLRLGDLEEGERALVKLAELDGADRVGHKLLAQVLSRMGRDDDYGESVDAPLAAEPL